MIIDKFKNLELYKHATSNNVNVEYEDWQYNLDTANIVRLVAELEQLLIHSVVKSLKEKKKPTFKEWLEMYNYKKVKTLFVAHGKEYYYTEVYKQYQEWLRLHF